MKLSKYEIKVLNRMLSVEYNNQELVIILNSLITGYDYTSAGYFLELTNDILSKDRRTISEPTLFGRADNFEVGFLIFIENSKLILECHCWGNSNLPETIRDCPIDISDLKLND
jgi:hypothetical protein